jgi:hypothetical protein
MDLPDSMKRVSLEPKMVNIYEEFAQVGTMYVCPPSTAVLFQYLIPNDGYSYQLASFMWEFWMDGFEQVTPGPLLCYGAFSMTRNPYVWHWVTAGWVYGWTEHYPTRLGGMAQRYPGVYGMYVNNTSLNPTEMGIAIFMYKKYVES